MKKKNLLLTEHSCPSAPLAHSLGFKGSSEASHLLWGRWGGEWIGEST